MGFQILCSFTPSLRAFFSFIKDVWGSLFEPFPTSLCTLHSMFFHWLCLWSLFFCCLESWHWLQICLLGPKLRITLICISERFFDQIEASIFVLGNILPDPFMLPKSSCGLACIINLRLAFFLLIFFVSQTLRKQ